MNRPGPVFSDDDIFTELEQRPAKFHPREKDLHEIAQRVQNGAVVAIAFAVLINLSGNNDLWVPLVEDQDAVSQGPPPIRPESGVFDLAASLDQVWAETSALLRARGEDPAVALREAATVLGAWHDAPQDEAELPADGLPVDEV